MKWDTWAEFSASMDKIDSKISLIENFFAIGAAIPVLNILMGVSRGIAGFIQSLWGLFFSAGLWVFASSITDRLRIHRSLAHLFHGLGNMACGLLESVPFVGTVMFFLRVGKVQEAKRERLVTGQENKWMPYESIVDRQLHVESSLREQIGTERMDELERDVHALAIDGSITAREKVRRALQGIRTAERLQYSVLRHDDTPHN